MRRPVLAALLCLVLPAALDASDSTSPTFRDVITVTGVALDENLRSAISILSLFKALATGARWSDHGATALAVRGA